MKQALLFSFLGILGSSGVLFQNCQTPKYSFQHCPYQLYVCLGKLPEASEQFIQQHQIKKIKLITGSSIDKNKDEKVDEAHLRRQIRKMFPNKQSQGIAVLNWEGQAIKTLEQSPAQSKAFKQIEQQYLKAYRIAKSERPNLQWGFYGLPFRSYWNMDKKWQNSHEKLRKLLSTTDIICPSVYDFYKNDNAFAGQKKDSLYVQQNTRQALKFGQQFNKPVLPFYWHRWHNSNKKRGLKLIPWPEFRQHIEAGLNTSYQGKKIEGIIWWGADDYFYRRQSKALVVEARAEKNFDEYHNKIILDYLPKIHQVLCHPIKP